MIYPLGRASIPFLRTGTREGASTAAIARLALIVLTFVGGIAPRLTFLSARPDALLRVVPDDAFYYFEIARHVVAGHGSTFDGIHVTNGYHPLWLLVLLPFAAAIHQPWTFVRVALGLTVLCSTLTGVVLYRTAAMMTGRWWLALGATALYLLDPQSMLLELDGLETALCTLLFTLGVSLILATYRRVQETWRRSMLFGLALGLLMLVRTDNVFYAAILLALYAVVMVRRRLADRAAVAAVAAGIVVAPWLLWNFLQFHSIIQDSGLAVPYMLQHGYLLDGHTAAQAAEVSRQTLRQLIEVDLYRALGIPPWAYALAVATLPLPLVRRTPSVVATPLLRRSILALLALGVGAACLLFIHSFVRWYARDYYVDHLIVLSALLFAAALAAVADRVGGYGVTGTRHLSRLTPAVRTIAVIPAVILCVGTLQGHATLARSAYPWQVDMGDAGMWIAAHTEAGERVASFNAGIIGYLSGRPVINLDGVADNAAFTAIKERRLLSFMRTAGAQYYVDWDPIMLQQWYAPFLGREQAPVHMTLIATFRRSGIADPDRTLRAYRLTWETPRVQVVH